MKQVRLGVFETNSSSTHAIVICTDEEYLNLKNYKMVIDRCGYKVIDISETILSSEEFHNRYLTLNDWYSQMEGDSSEKEYTTKSGDKIVILGGEISYR